jgi:two-component system response regulator GlrR
LTWVLKKKKERLFLKIENKSMNERKENILVVDNDPNILQVLRMRLASGGYSVTAATGAEAALKLAEKKPFDLVLIDLKLNGDDGIQLMEDIHQLNPDIPVIILTAYGTIKSAVRAMKKGAYSYVTKPFDGHELLLQINNCLEKSRLSKEVKRLKNLVSKTYGVDNIIGKSDKIQKVLAQVAQAATTDSNVYIEGESGTGKELIAKSLHVASGRKDGPFVAVNCAAIPEHLMESELFGYEKGAFTGADTSKKGLFVQADSGTFFLDEISEMHPSMQVKMLRALEEKEFYPVGGRQTIKVDARIIAASNKNLEQEIEKGNFREDLFYRIHVIPIKLPSLGERKEDIPILSRYFLQKFAREMDKEIEEFSTEAMHKLISYPWPGNIRELENTIECAVAMSKQNIITEDLILQAHNIDSEGLKPFKYAKENFEKNYLIQLFEVSRGNVSKAAKLAGKYRADIYELIKKYNLKLTDYRDK